MSSFQADILCASPECTAWETGDLSLRSDIAVLSACSLKKLYKPARDMDIVKKVYKILREDLQERNGGD